MRLALISEDTFSDNAADLHLVYFQTFEKCSTCLISGMVEMVSSELRRSVTYYGAWV